MKKLKFRIRHSGGPDGCTTISECEVIGNIHEHPDILYVKDEIYHET